MENTEVQVLSFVDNLKEQLIKDTVVDAVTFQGILNRYSELEITEVNDMVSYNLVVKGMKELQQYRINIQKTRKQISAPLLSAQKELISVENEFINLIDPIEKKLQEKKTVIDDKKEALANELFTKRNALLLENGFELIGKFYVSGIMQIEANNLREMEEIEFNQYIEHGKKEIERKVKEQELRDVQAQKIIDEKKALEEKIAELTAQNEAYRKLHPEEEVKKVDPVLKSEPLPELSRPKTPMGVSPMKTAQEMPSINEDFLKGVNFTKLRAIDIIENPRKYGLDKLTKDGMIEKIDSINPTELW